MKRIDAITRCKGILSEVLNRKSARILRQVDQAIDMAKDSAEEAREAADEIMNSLGESAESSQTSDLLCKLNAYKDKIAEAKGWDEVVTIFEDLKIKLYEDVQVEEEGAPCKKSK